MAEFIKVMTQYFFGIGYVIDENKVLEVRSISSEIIEEGKEARRSLIPMILKSEICEVDRTILGEAIFKKASQDIYYNEWILNEDEVQPFLSNAELANIPFSQINSFPLRPPVNQSA